MNSLKFKRIKNAGHKIFCIYTEMYKIYKSNDLIKLNDVLSN